MIIYVLTKLVFYTLGTPNEHMVQSRPDRIRMTMFPEESMEVPSTQMIPTQQTNLQRMSQSTQILKATLSNLATYQVRCGKGRGI